MSRGFDHQPVMLEEVLALFGGLGEGLLLDATVGGGGHAAALLEAHPRLELLGLDRDPAAVDAARRRLAPYGHRARVEQGRFDQLIAALHAAGDGRALAGVLFDLGVSSHQLDSPERGFSFRHDAPLDMRMDPGSGVAAAELLNTASEEALATLLAAHGEERFARRIAAALVAARPLTTTGELAAAVAFAVPAAARRRGHPARRVFQALRAAVNEELEQLGPAIGDAVAALVPGGRIVVLSYHSGEDRLVKARLAELASGGCHCPPGLPCVCGAVGSLRLLTRGARLPSAGEVAANPRAASARLRAAERTGSDGETAGRRPAGGG